MPIPGSFWGGMFPEASGMTFFAGHFPIAQGGSQPVPIAALLLESGSTMTIKWSTGISGTLIGKERRANLQHDPVIELAGPALIASSTVREQRALLAQYAAAGEPFAIGLPWEGVPLKTRTTGTTLPVESTAELDWAHPGVRLIVAHPTRTRGSISTYIVSTTADTIEVADAVGNVGELGAEIIPTIQCYLDPQQSFERFTGDSDPEEGDVERWSIKATAAVPGIVAAAQFATLELADVDGSGVMDGVTISALEIGAAGNDLSIRFVGDAIGVDYAEVVGDLLIYHFIPGVTTVAGMMSRIERTDFVAMLGDRTSDVLTIDDEFGPTALSGGADQLPVEMGTGATLTTFLAKPVWDEPINVSVGAQDSVQTRAQIVQLGGSAFPATKGPKPDWGRQISARRDLCERWQWAKKFIWYTKGAWRSFWLPTWRNDLVWISKAAGTITITSGAAAGDFFKWYPAHRTTLQLEQEDGTITYAQITSAVDNGNGTITVSIADTSGTPITLSSSPVTLLSWLELTRFAEDDIRVTFQQGLFVFPNTGRVIQR